MFRSINGPLSGPRELSSMQIHVKFMEALQLDGIPSVLQFEIELYYYYYRYSALGPVWTQTRAQSVDWYSSGTLHPGQVLRGSVDIFLVN